MADEQRDAGQAISRPGRPGRRRPPAPTQLSRHRPARRGGAPAFDRETGRLVRRAGGGGMLGNRWVREWGGQDADRDEPGEHGRTGEPGEQGRDSGPADAGEAPHGNRRGGRQ